MEIGQTSQYFQSLRTQNPTCRSSGPCFQNSGQVLDLLSPYQIILLVRMFAQLQVRKMPRRRSNDIKCTVQYEVFLSPSYRVPVVYFSMQDAESRPLRDIDDVYTLLVPQAFKNQLRDVGVIGGISTGDHPITGIPTFFIHPCQTAEALQRVAAGRSVQVEEYMFLWLGIVGGCVGLHLTPDDMWRPP
ncbi:hypothetical protein EJ08DRAFT_389142 [Tothia fuscella]|uniref:Ubiquitin-like-conjugating enzyme ATG10 n=1 Tax=Tothia fuscella TaxID=1048955 RepID=A0A9P4P1T6_9PEZI|nr:hypothetical protein EJ08DRAFT_389142 [Tothia fuscella]